MNSYEHHIKEDLDRLEDFMIDRKIDQGNPWSNDTTDSECGCCAGAHIARCFGSVYREALDHNFVMNYMPRVKTWRDSFHNYVSNYTLVDPDMHDIDEEELEGNDDLVAEWLSHGGKDEGVLSIDYRSGVKILENILGLHEHEKPLFHQMLSVFAYRDTQHLWDPWSHMEWEHKNIVVPIRMAAIVWDYFDREIRYKTNDVAQDIHDMDMFIQRVIDGDLDDKINPLLAQEGIDIKLGEWIWEHRRSHGGK